MPMRTRRRQSAINRIIRVLTYTGAAAIVALGVWHYGDQSLGAATTGIFPISASPAEQPRVTRGGDAWQGSAGSARRVAAPRPEPTSSIAAPGARLIDVVTRVRDGDTIVVGLIPIRIANLDCAERGSTAGDAATRRITELVRGQQLVCTLEGRRSWDREVGVCALSDGRDIGEVLIAEGYCGRWR